MYRYICIHVHAVTAYLKKLLLALSFLCTPIKIRYPDYSTNTVMIFNLPTCLYSSLAKYRIKNIAMLEFKLARVIYVTYIVTMSNGFCWLQSRSLPGTLLEKGSWVMVLGCVNSATKASSTHQIWRNTCRSTPVSAKMQAKYSQYPIQ